MSFTPLVSVIVPVYNAGQYLRPCMDTLVNQTLKDIEIVCVLDCPTDGSDKVIEEYAAKDPRFVVIRNEKNLHIGESRNVGIRAARGKYIDFSDHDDTHELDMYEILYQNSENGKKEVVLSGRLASLLSQNTPPVSDDIVTRWARCVFLYQSWLVTMHIYKRSFLLKNDLLFSDTKHFSGEDGLFNLCVLCKIEEPRAISLVNMSFYHHILYNSSTSSSTDHSEISKWVLFLFKVNDLLKNKQSALAPQNYQFGLSQLLVRIMYTQFRLKRRQKGLKKTVGIIEQAFYNNDFLLDILRHTHVFMKKLTFPKRAFLVILKLHFRTAIAKAS